MNIRKLLTRLVSLALIAVFLPTVAMADTWYLEDGSITVSATESGQNVSQGGVTKADSAPVIRNRDSSASTTNNVTIKADTGATANVTLEDTNIDTTGGAGPKGAGDAAVRTEGAGNVNLNVELDNTLQSGDTRAGVEKGNGGSLTIGSESGSGQLVAVGGDGGAGIGSGGRYTSGNYNVGNITITGGDIFATGNDGGAGIGGGWCCSTSDITITGGNVTAVGKQDKPGSIGGAGIGGGGFQNSNAGGGSNIKITGGRVTAVGGNSAAGIGGSMGSNGENIAISDAKVRHRRHMRCRYRRRLCRFQRQRRTRDEHLHFWQRKCKGRRRRGRQYGRRRCGHWRGRIASGDNCSGGGCGHLRPVSRRQRRALRPRNDL